jgi:hypothetical protein
VSIPVRHKDVEDHDLGGQRWKVGDDCGPIDGGSGVGEKFRVIHQGGPAPAFSTRAPGGIGSVRSAPTREQT